MKGCGSLDGMASIPLLLGHSFVYVNVMKIKCTYMYTCIPKNMTETCACVRACICVYTLKGISGCVCVCVCVYTLKGYLGGGVGLKK